MNELLAFSLGGLVGIVSMLIKPYRMERALLMAVSSAIPTLGPTRITKTYDAETNTVIYEVLPK